MPKVSWWMLWCVWILAELVFCTALLLFYFMLKKRLREAENEHYYLSLIILVLIQPHLFCHSLNLCWNHPRTDVCFQMCTALLQIVISIMVHSSMIHLFTTSGSQLVTTTNQPHERRLILKHIWGTAAKTNRKIQTEIYSACHLRSRGTASSCH